MPCGYLTAVAKRIPLLSFFLCPIIRVMKSLSSLFRLGPGPSSSHTIGPHLAAKRFYSLVEGQKPDRFSATFYGSLAYTAVGHGSSKAVSDVFVPLPCQIIFDKETKASHPLTMKFQAFRGESLIKSVTYRSLGGGEISSDEDEGANERDIYPFSSFEQIKAYLKDNNIANLKDFCLRFENPEIDSYLLSCVKAMFHCVENGLREKGKIPANSNPRLQLNRVAGDIFSSSSSLAHEDGRNFLWMTSYA